MEIWIVGIIIVGLMIYVSTRIKKASKQAYARETFETEEFQITKPDDFLIPVEEDSPYVFEARSKEFGSEDVRDFYQCLATVTAKTGAANPKNYAESRTEKGAELDSHNKIISGANKHFHLKIDVLSEFKEKYQSAVDEMLSSFAVK
jgi:hypothetical protein